jgi:hypothetical protein
MSLTTPQSLVSLALRAIGIIGEGQIASAETNNDTFDVLNGMIGQWNRKRWMIYHEVDVSVAVTGQQSYVVGPGGDINVPRVDRLEWAFYRQFAQNAPGQQFVDFPLRILQSREDYAQIPLKELTSWPLAVFFDSGNPTGTLYPVPIPTVLTDSIHIGLKEHLSQFVALIQPINLPDEYVEAIWTNLAIRVAAIFPGTQITPAIEGLAKASISTVQTANTQIPTMNLVPGLTRPPLFNIFSYQRY